MLCFKIPQVYDFEFNFYYTLCLKLGIAVNIKIKLKIIKHIATFKKSCKYNKIYQSLSMIDYVPNIDLLTDHKILDFTIFVICLKCY